MTAGTTGRERTGLPRSLARLAAVQALYRQASSEVPTPSLLHEFHTHWGGESEELPLSGRDTAFFNDVVKGVMARVDELDELVARYLARGWSLARLDRLMVQILRAGAYELVARPDVPRAVVIKEYVDVADAFYGQKEVGFINALLDRIGREVRDAGGSAGRP